MIWTGCLDYPRRPEGPAAVHQSAGRRPVRVKLQLLRVPPAPQDAGQVRGVSRKDEGGRE